MNKEQKENLQILSEAVFGAKGRAEKILKQGMPRVIAITKMEEVTKEDGTKEMVEKKVPKLSKSGRPEFEIIYPDYDELMKIMQDEKTKKDALIAQIREMQKQAAEEETKQETNSQVTEAIGSSV